MAASTHHNARQTLFDLCQLVEDYQLLLIRKRYLALVEEDSDFVRNKSIHAFIWNIFKKISKAYFVLEIAVAILVLDS